MIQLTAALPSIIGQILPASPSATGAGSDFATSMAAVLGGAPAAGGTGAASLQPVALGGSDLPEGVALTEFGDILLGDDPVLELVPTMLAAPTATAADVSFSVGHALAVAQGLQAAIFGDTAGVVGAGQALGRPAPTAVVAAPLSTVALTPASTRLTTVAPEVLLPVAADAPVARLTIAAPAPAAPRGQRVVPDAGPVASAFAPPVMFPSVRLAVRAASDTAPDAAIGAAHGSKPQVVCATGEQAAQPQKAAPVPTPVPSPAPTALPDLPVALHVPVSPSAPAAAANAPAPTEEPADDAAASLPTAVAPEPMLAAIEPAAPERAAEPAHLKPVAAPCIWQEAIERTGPAPVGFEVADAAAPQEARTGVAEPAAWAIDPISTLTDPVSALAAPVSVLPVANVPLTAPVLSPADPARAVTLSPMATNSSAARPRNNTFGGAVSALPDQAKEQIGEEAAPIVAVPDEPDAAAFIDAGQAAAAAAVDAAPIPAGLVTVPVPAQLEPSRPSAATGAPPRRAGAVLASGVTLVPRGSNAEPFVSIGRAPLAAQPAAITRTLPFAAAPPAQPARDVAAMPDPTAVITRASLKVEAPQQPAPAYPTSDTAVAASPPSALGLSGDGLSAPAPDRTASVTPTAAPLQPAAPAQRTASRTAAVLSSPAPAPAPAPAPVTATAPATPAPAASRLAAATAPGVQVRRSPIVAAQRDVSANSAAASPLPSVTPPRVVELAAGVTPAAPAPVATAAAAKPDGPVATSPAAPLRAFAALADAATPVVQTATPAQIALAVQRPAAAPVPGFAAPAAQVFAAAMRAVAQDERAAERPAATAPVSMLGMGPLAGVQQVVVAAVDSSNGAHLDMRQDSWPQAMIAHIERLRDAADAADTSIRIVPDALGSIEVSVRRSGDTVHVQFAAEQAATRQLLHDAQPRLAEYAEARGMRLGSTSVDPGSGGNAGAGTGAGSNPGADGARQFAARRNAAAAPAPVSSVDEAPASDTDRIA